MNDMQWEVGNDAEAPPPTGDLALLAKEAADLKAELEKYEAIIEPMGKRLTEVRELIKNTLDAMSLDKFHAHGWNFHRKTKSSVQTPKSPEEKEALFAFLRKEGLFDSMVSIHSATLNNLYESLAEKAAKEGNLDFKLPGVTEPKPYTSLEMRRAKK